MPCWSLDDRIGTARCFGDGSPIKPSWRRARYDGIGSEAHDSIGSHPLSEASDHGLPDFGRPPVTEVVLAARFSTQQDLSLVRIVQFWERHLRDEGFVRVEENPRYEPPIERFDQPEP